MNVKSLATASPALVWVPQYRSEWLRPDLVAGLTLAAYLLPAGIGDASLAGLPAQAGLYACLFSGLVFWIFCSSKQTIITVTSPGSSRRLFRLAEAHGNVRDALRRSGFAQAHLLAAGQTTHVVLSEWQLEAATAGAPR